MKKNHILLRKNMIELSLIIRMDFISVLFLVSIRFIPAGNFSVSATALIWLPMQNLFPYRKRITPTPAWNIFWDDTNMTPELTTSKC